MKSLFYLVLIFSFLTCNNPASEKQSNKDSSFTSDPNQTKSTSRWPQVNLRHLKIDSSLTTMKLVYKGVDARDLRNELMDSLPSITINKVNYWLLENDILLNEDELLNYCKGKLGVIDASTNEENRVAALTVATDLSSDIIRWPQGYIIKFSVLKKSFFDKTNNYPLVVKRMKDAASDWMSICNVKIEYEPKYDGLPTGAPLPDDLTFFVVEDKLNAEATSFYPMDPDDVRRLYIGRLKYYNSKYDGTGIFRHEFGHILGFRHEQIWFKDQGCDRGEGIILNYLRGKMNASLLGSAPDPFSVMMYKCGTLGSYELSLTEADKASAKALYP